MRIRRSTSLAGALALLAAVTVTAGVTAKTPAPLTVTYLISDGSVSGTPTDPDLVNGWGLTRGPGTPWWVADNGTGKSTLYDGAGTKLGLVVEVDESPTGTVFNGGSGFVVGGAAARFIFSTEEGTIFAWQGGLGTTAAQVADQGGAGAIYKGLAIGTTGDAGYLYATDFHNARIDVFDSSFALQTWDGAFVDPKLPKGYAPFGIQNLNGAIFVTYAKQDAAAEDEQAGVSRGIVDMFGTDGSFLGRVAQHGLLNAPWGLAWAPDGFGSLGGDLIVGNFGDGRLNAFHWDGRHWDQQGMLVGTDRSPISIDGLWAIAFGGGTTNNGPATSLFFTAGPNEESGGAFGTITSP